MAEKLPLPATTLYGPPTVSMSIPTQISNSLPTYDEVVSSPPSVSTAVPPRYSTLPRHPSTEPDRDESVRPPHHPEHRQEGAFGTPPSAPPADLVFASSPGSAHPRQSLPPRYSTIPRQDPDVPTSSTIQQSGLVSAPTGPGVPGFPGVELSHMCPHQPPVNTQPVGSVGYLPRVDTPPVDLTSYHQQGVPAPVTAVGYLPRVDTPPVDLTSYYQQGVPYPVVTAGHHPGGGTLPVNMSGYHTHGVPAPVDLVGSPPTASPGVEPRHSLPPRYSTLPRDHRPEAGTDDPLRPGSPRAAGNTASAQLTLLQDVPMNETATSCLIDTFTNATTGNPDHLYVRTPSCMRKYKLDGTPVRKMKMTHAAEGGATIDAERDLIIVTSGQTVARVTRLGEKPGAMYDSSVRVSKAQCLTSITHYTKGNHDRYVAVDTGLNSVLIIKPNSGDAAKVISGGDGEFVSVACHEAAPHALVPVSDCVNHCVRLYDLKAKLKQELGSHGTGRCQLDNPRGLAMDSQGRVIVCDHGNRRVVRYTPSTDAGSWIWECLVTPEQLKGRHPGHVAVSATGHVMVTVATDEDTHAWLLFDGYDK